MTALHKAQALIAAAQELANRAMTDPELAERLLVDTNGVISEAAGEPIPAGVLMKARRRDDGTLEISGEADPRFEGELDDAALENVAGGATGIEYGLIAALLSVSIISAASVLGTRLSSTFTSTAAAVKAS